MNESLKEESRGASGGIGRQRLHDLLLVSEVAVALMLLIGAGVMLQSFLRMQRIDPGVRPEGVIKFEVDLQMASHRYSGDIRDVTFEVMELVRSLPGVIALGSAGEMPLIKSGWQAPLSIEGRPWPDAEETPVIDIRIITPGLFAAMGIPMLEGRDVSESDHNKSPAVCAVNKTFADKFFPNGNVVGKRISASSPGSWFEIVGIVGSVRNFSTQSVKRPEIYPNYRQNYWGGAELGPTFVLRTTLDTSRMMTAVRRKIEGPTREVSLVGKVQTIHDILDSSVATERLRTTLLSVFGAVALLLATVGIYGVMSYSVSQRTHEIRIRMALGADAGAVRRMIAWKGLKLTLAGVTLGLAASYAVTRLLATQIPEVESVDLVSYIGIPVVLTIVALIACLIPARRATRINPVVALRHE